MNMETEEVKIADFIKAIGLTMECEHKGVKTEKVKDWTGKEIDHSMDEWACTLTCGKQSMTTLFRQGLAYRKINRQKASHVLGYVPTMPEANKLQRDSSSIKDEKWIGMSIPTKPELDSVLDSLRSDSECWDNARNFDDFCSDLGYDTDSRKAESIYKACGEVSKELKYLLGSENYKALLETVERL
jgi:hypothetical protein